jgi:hypothetical protein
VRPLTRTVCRDTEECLVQEASRRVICSKRTKEEERSKSFVQTRANWLDRLASKVFGMTGKIKTQRSTRPHTKRNKSKESIVNHKRANATGFQKRIRGDQSKNMDVYEFNDDAKGKHRRNHVSTDLTKEEKRELGGDRDHWEPDEIERVRRQLQSGEDGVVFSEYDEDIDSDEAFDVTDEEAFGAFRLKVRHAGWYSSLYSCIL